MLQCNNSKSLPAHPFNALILPILSGCLQSVAIVIFLLFLILFLRSGFDF